MIGDLGSGASRDLLWLLEVLFGEEGILVTRGDEPAPKGWLAAERYNVVPGIERARFLLPVSRPAARTALSAYNSLRPARFRAGRTLVGAAVGSGLGRLAFRDTVAVHIADDSALLPSVPLAEVLGRSDLALAAGIRPPGPYRKPVVQVLSTSGELLGYAKLGWSDLTRRMVTNEALVLEELASGASADGIRAPRPLGRKTWRGQTLLVTEPMPRDLRRYEPSQGPPPAEITRAVAGRPGTTSGPFSSSQHRSSILDRFDAVREAAEAAGLGAATERMLASVSARHAGTELEYGSWHGDWSPWNLGRSGGELWAWDWEYAGTDVPIGLDPVHFHFQVAFIGERRNLAESFARARSAGSRELQLLGCSPTQIDLILDLHVVQVTLRYLEALKAGAPENPRFMAAAADAIRRVAEGREP